jgi:hypothetical protein
MRETDDPIIMLLLRLFAVMYDDDGILFLEVSDFVLL